MYSEDIYAQVFGPTLGDSGSETSTRYKDNSYDTFDMDIPWGWISFSIVFIALAVLAFLYIKKNLKKKPIVCSKSSV